MKLIACSFTKNMKSFSGLYRYFLINQSSYVLLFNKGYIYLIWLTWVTVWFLYNAWVIPLRVVFLYQTESNAHIWFVFDCIADIFYVVDILAFKSHKKFIREGFWIYDSKEAWLIYIRSLQFLVSLVLSRVLKQVIPLVRNCQINSDFVFYRQTLVLSSHWILSVLYGLQICRG